jgi:hypothetical protein
MKQSIFLEQQQMIYDKIERLKEELHELQTKYLIEVAEDIVQ